MKRFLCSKYRTCLVSASATIVLSSSVLSVVMIFIRAGIVELMSVIFITTSSFIGTEINK